MKFTKAFILIIALALAGCLGPTKTVKFTLTQRIEVDGAAIEAMKKNGTQPTFSQSVTLTGLDLETATAQEKKDITNIPLGLYGGQANVDSETENAVAEQDNSLNDSANDNSTTPVVKPVPVLKSEKEKVIVDNDDAEILGNVIETLTMKPFEDKSMVWLSSNGKRYPKTVTFTFDNDCGSFTVPDMTKAMSEDGTMNRDQRFYYPGDWPGQDRSMACMDGCASVFTEKGCAANTVILTEG